VQDSKEQDNLLISLDQNFKSLNQKLEHVNFGTYNKTLVSIPEGFKGYFINYLVTLNKLQSDIYDNGSVMLKEYNSILSSFITNKEDKISLRDHTTFFNKLSKDRENINKQLDIYFTTGSNSKSYLQNVIQRFADLDNIVGEVKNLRKKHNSQNIDKLSDQVKEAVSLLDVVIKQSNDSIVKLSGSSAMNISTGAYEVAKFVELLSIFRFKTDQAVTSVTRLIEQLNLVIIK
jgi:hypothetical protein